MQNLSIEQVAADTRISSRFIQALEDEQFEVLPAPVYVRGFLRSYANYLKMDAQPLLEELSRYEEADGYVVRGPAPWRGPGAGTRPAQRNPSNDPFRPRPPAPAPGQQATGLAPFVSPVPASNGAGDERPEWEPELDAPAEYEAYPEDAYEDEAYDEQPAWVARERERGTQGVLLAKPVALRGGNSGPPLAGIAVAALLLFGAAAAGAFFMFRGDDDGGVAAGQDSGDETPASGQTPGNVVEVRTPLPTTGTTPGATPNATADNGTPAAGASVTPTATGNETPDATETTPTATQESVQQPTQAPTTAPAATATTQVFPTATPAPPTATPTPVPPTATPTEAIVHPLGTNLCGTGVDPCGPPPLIVICGPNGWFIDPNGSYVNSGWEVRSASRIGEADSVC